MNIWGYKRHIKLIKEQLKEGKKVLGISRFNKLTKRKERMEYAIKKLREERKKKK